ncbi:MAG: 3-deoxy-D-manno-octulosonate cytidylyltransferase [Desulfobacteraceae bacterium 4572_87]|nr:MAG: 3-deoxy-D-manno-octulosonate cytidylyltransferase [Desulfobacteraceae bacterium 4572_87]
MNIYAFIPARYQSSRFPGKPLAMIHGKPMIRHTYERALACPELSAVYVATDDERILECVKGFGGKALMTRPGHVSGTDRIAEAAQKIGVKDRDLVVNIQGDQPAFQPEVVSTLIKPLVEDESIPMSTLKCRIQDEKEVLNPNHVKVVTDNRGVALYFSRCAIPFCRDAHSDPAYYKHLGFYCFRMDFLLTFTALPEGKLESLEKLEQLRALENGYRIRVPESMYDSIEVDLPDDVGAIEECLKGRPQSATPHPQ